MYYICTDNVYANIEELLCFLVQCNSRIGFSFTFVRPPRFFIQDLYPALVDLRGVMASMARIPLELLTVDIGGDPVPDALTLEQVLAGTDPSVRSMAATV
jgi:hypothetical protein